MSFFSIILFFKIIVTLTIIVVPFILTPKEKIDKMMGMTSPSPYLYRLYGVAVLAILVAYSGGIYQASIGIVPWAVIAMGLVSNFGATLTLLLTNVAKRNLFHTIFFGAISISLLWVTLFPKKAIEPINFVFN